ncbi:MULTISPECIES: acyl carrier protein [Atopobiaceae]|uniref:acyl carrier protein n=1 Tax=Atopobiaceae TaxID=1643824 RepID=UPI00034E4F68|nr:MULTISPECIES: phosphopantetheine-binding protein [Atopobiaceae]EPD77924.1 acyl carrier protein [Atopobium sp. oral taxon 199 str. F0494]
MANSETLDKVIALVRETLDIDEDTELDETTSFKDLGADSFDLLQLVTDLEQEFDMTFDAESLSDVATIGDAVEAIEEA